jgi:uncharacterized protein (TIGR00730 family)
VQRVCVFCGAASGGHESYREAAAALGSELVLRDLGLVYGAGRTGLMGALAVAALAAGGEVIGVVPQALHTPELVHASLTRLHVVADLGARKALMAKLSDAFIALPGGLGTLDELLEVAAARQLGFHEKPVGVLNVAGYFDPLLEQLEHAVREGFVAEAQRHLVAVATSPVELLDEIAARSAAR